MIPPEVAEEIRRHGVPCCLIGAAALAVHGFARYSADIDLLTLDRRVLSENFWKGASPAPEVRVGDADDPLAGVVRWHVEPEVDLIAGKGHAARFALETAAPAPGLPCPVATPLALALLKLEAASPQDLADVLSLAAVQRELNGAPWVAEIPSHVAKLSAAARAAWQQLEPALARILTHG